MTADLTPEEAAALDLEVVGRTLRRIAADRGVDLHGPIAAVDRRRLELAPSLFQELGADGRLAARSHPTGRAARPTPATAPTRAPKEA